MDIARADVRYLLENDDFIGDLIKVIIANPNIMDVLIGDIVDGLEDLKEDDPEIVARIMGVVRAGDSPKRNEGSDKTERIEDIRAVGVKTARKMRRSGYESVQQVAEMSMDDIKHRILSASMDNPYFREKIVAYLVKEMRE